MRVYDIAAGTDKAIPIRLESDFDQTRESGSRSRSSS